MIFQTKEFCLKFFQNIRRLGVLFEGQPRAAMRQNPDGKMLVWFNFKLNSLVFFCKNGDFDRFAILFHDSDPSLRFTVAEFPIIWQSELNRETISPDWFPSKYEISFDIIFWNVLSRSDRITILPDVFVRYCLFTGSTDGSNNASAKNHAISHQSWRETGDYEVFRSTMAVNSEIHHVVDSIALLSITYLTS